MRLTGLRVRVVLVEDADSDDTEGEPRRAANRRGVAAFVRQERNDLLARTGMYLQNPSLQQSLQSQKASESTHCVQQVQVPVSMRLA